MKRRSLFSCVLSCILLIATVLQPVHASERRAPAEHSASSASASSHPDSSHGTLGTPLSDPLYQALYDCINNAEPVLEYESPTYLSDSYLNKLIYSMYEDYPEFFYLDFISRIDTEYYDPTSGALLYVIYEFTPVYTMSKSKILSAKADWEARLSEILSIVSPEMSDLEKLLVLHDYLCTHFSYDTSFEIYDSYNFLIEKKGVCQSYAGTYSALLTRLGIPNLFATSDEMQHVWNIVQLDGEWYHVDVTWDDPTPDQPGKALHSAFLRSDEGIRSVDHPSWEAAYACTSTQYDNSFFTGISSTVVTDGTHLYGVDRHQKAILRYDPDSMTAEPLVDLSGYRWYVWGDDIFYDTCYSNLYSDGTRLYFSTPLSIEAIDLESGAQTTVCSYTQGDGYLYAMRFDGESRRFVCTVSKEPSRSESEFMHGIAHNDQTTVNGILTSTVCSDCGTGTHTVIPLEGEAFGVAASLRPTPQKNGYHDLRISLSVALDAIYSLGTIDYILELKKSDGTVESITLHSENDHFDDFSEYDELIADGKVYTTDEDHSLFGFFISGIRDGSWASLSFRIVESAAQELLYTGSISYEQLASPTAEV